MTYLCYLFLYAYSGVQNILCCVFVFLRLMYPMLPVSLDCPFLIAPSVFSSVYLINTRFQRLPAANGNTFIQPIYLLFMPMPKPGLDVNKILSVIIVLRTFMCSMCYCVITMLPIIFVDLSAV